MRHPIRRALDLLLNAFLSLSAQAV